MKRFATILACLALSACSLWPWGGEEQQPAQPAGPRTIGVVSAIGDSITLADVGSNGWQKGSTTVSIESWHIDKTVTDEVTAALQQHNYDVRPVTYDPAKFSAAAIGGPVVRGGIFNRKQPDLGPIARSSVQPGNLDYYLVLVEAGADSGAYRLHGIGLLRQRGGLAAYALYHAFLIDGHSGKTVADVRAEPLGNSWYDTSKIDGPFTSLDMKAWPKPITSSTPEQQQMLHQAVETMLKQSLPRTVSAIVQKQP
ncbi:MAG: hypothetical protein ABWY00_12145 [Dongiaceae bacterium]